MYYAHNEHNPPYFHAYYQDDKAAIDINSCELKEGELPKKQIELASAWSELKKEELLANWKLA